jgi:aspartate/methionine/tyrosine aminotransferase
MKLGWMVVNGPEELVRPALERLEVLADTYLSVGTAVQHAAPVLLAQRPTIQQELLERIRGNLEHLDQGVEGSACSRLPAEGGWYAVLRVPGTLDDEEWAVRLMEEEGVYVHPGHLFHFSGGAYLVLSLIVGQESFSEGVGRLLRVVAAPA